MTLANIISIIGATNRIYIQTKTSLLFRGFCQDIRAKEESRMLLDKTVIKIQAIDFELFMITIED